MKAFRILYCLPLLLLVACGSASRDKDEALNVYLDRNFTTLYMRDSGGITMADGTISILLPDGSSLFMTGDCFLGEVHNGQLSPDNPMLNNTLIHISADCRYLETIHGGTAEKPTSLCIPPEAQNSSRRFWYWPGHGYQHGSRLFLYMTKFYQGGVGQWGFVFGGSDLVELDMEDGYKTISITPQYGEAEPVHWGHSVIKEGDTLYIYGTRSGQGYPTAQLCVSRAKIDPVTGFPGAYEYFDGEGWVSGCASAAACAGLDVPVSEQFSVFRHGKYYVLLTQRKGTQAGDIYSFIAESPVGPWYNKKQLYVTTEQDNDKNLFTYNAMAHPQYINEKDELLINYNVNSYDTQQIFKDVNTYRPVFLRVPMKMILE